MNIQIDSIKMMKYKLKENAYAKDIFFIICSSYEQNINLENSLFLLFDDITNVSINSFNTECANKIKEYIVNNKIDNLVVCCDCGESRSSAIACAIMRYLNMDEDKIWNNPKYHPNILVYKIMCEAFELDVNDTLLEERKLINDNALKEAINSNRK